MRSGAIILFCVAVSAGLVLGQSAPPTPVSGAGYVGVVTGTNVYVRSNPRTGAYECTKLSYPVRVRVVGQSSAWFKILPPSGVFSVISKQYVRLDETRKVGVVTGDNVWVRAGGTERASGFWAHQRQLNSGDKVEVFGEVEEYYKIVPPEGVYFYISKRYVERADRYRRDPKTRPTAPATTTRPTHRSPTTREVMEAIKRIEESTAALEKFRALEAELFAEFKKPPERRDLDGLLATWRAFRAPPGSLLQPYTDYYVKYLQVAVENRHQRKIFQDLVEAAADKQKEYEMKRTKLVVQTPRPREVVYAAKGFLAPSVIYTGGPTGPKRFVLRDPKTGAIGAYAQSAGGRIKLSMYVGKYVGVLGPTRYDAEVRTTVVDVEQVKELPRGGTAPEPPKPVVQPLPPAPAPKPKPETKPVPKVTPTAPVEPTPPTAPAPEPKPTAEPKPKPKPTSILDIKRITKPPAKPAPKPEPKSTAEPKPKPKPTPITDIKPITKPPAKPAPKPEPKPTAEPKPKPKPTPIVDIKPITKPLVRPAPPVKPKPAAPRTAPKPTTRVAVPTTKPTTRPTTKAAVSRPVPYTALPAVAPTTQPIDEEEYD